MLSAARLWEGAFLERYWTGPMKKPNARTFGQDLMRGEGRVERES